MSNAEQDPQQHRSGVYVPPQRPGGQPPSTTRAEAAMEEIVWHLEQRPRPAPADLLEMLVREHRKADSDRLASLIEEHTRERQRGYLERIANEEQALDSAEKVSFLREKRDECNRRDFESTRVDASGPRPFLHAAREIQRWVNYWKSQDAKEGGRADLEYSEQDEYQQPAVEEVIAEAKAFPEREQIEYIRGVIEQDEKHKSEDVAALREKLPDRWTPSNADRGSGATSGTPIHRSQRQEKEQEAEAREALLEKLEARKGHTDKLQCLAEVWRRGGAGATAGVLHEQAVRLKREAVEEIRRESKKKATARERVAFLERELLELDLLDDYVPPGTYGGVVWNVKEKVQKLLIFWRRATDEDESEEIITGTDAPEYAFDAREVLRDKPYISGFQKLEREMEGQMTNGGSKVKSIKRGIGYNDLPQEEMTFHRFRTMLFEKVERMEKRFA